MFTRRVLVRIASVYKAYPGQDFYYIIGVYWSGFVVFTRRTLIRNLVYTRRFLVRIFSVYWSGFLDYSRHTLVRILSVAPCIISGSKQIQSVLKIFIVIL